MAAPAVGLPLVSAGRLRRVHPGAADAQGGRARFRLCAAFRGAPLLAELERGRQGRGGFSAAQFHEQLAARGDGPRARAIHEDAHSAGQDDVQRAALRGGHGAGSRGARRAGIRERRRWDFPRDRGRQLRERVGARQGIAGRHRRQIHAPALEHRRDDDALQQRGAHAAHETSREQNDPRRHGLRERHAPAAARAHDRAEPRDVARAHRHRPEPRHGRPALAAAPGVSRDALPLGAAHAGAARHLRLRPGPARLARPAESVALRLRERREALREGGHPRHRHREPRRDGDDLPESLLPRAAHVESGRRHRRATRGVLSEILRPRGGPDERILGRDLRRVGADAFHRARVFHRADDLHAGAGDRLESKSGQGAEGDGAVAREAGRDPRRAAPARARAFHGAELRGDRELHGDAARGERSRLQNCRRAGRARPRSAGGADEAEPRIYHLQKHRRERRGLVAR